MSWLSSIFTPPGQNAADAVNQGKSTAASYSQSDLGPWNDYVNGQMNYMKGQQPTAQNAVSQLGQFTNQSGRNLMANAYGQWAQGAAQQAGSNGYTHFAGNPALGQAYQLGAMNDANTATNQYAQQINSPQGQQQAYGTYLSGLQSQSPDFNGLSQLTGNVMGQPTPQVGQGLGSYIGGIASLASNFV